MAMMEKPATTTETALERSALIAVATILKTFGTVCFISTQHPQTVAHSLMTHHALTPLRETA